MNRVRRRLLVRGVVQGVGFRPFVYREATRLGLGGSVWNRGDAGVEITVEGSADAVDAFMRAVLDRPPQLACIDSVDAEDLAPTGEVQFVIAPSREGDGSGGAIPPDTAICPECIADLRGVGRYGGYWATSCTDCGPRFTVIEGLPYDRPRTSMQEFPLCPACASEYGDPGDRRYHAQTTACPVCGPRLAFDGTVEDAVHRAADALRRGEILAVKGIGGTHIACDARSAVAAETLRRRLGRSAQPFALMAREEDLAALSITEPEELRLLSAPERPIVVVRQRPGALPAAIAPGLDSVGVMLPYSGLHVLLLDEFGGPLVMTSANLPGRPMLIENDEIGQRLLRVVDHALLHDRRIVARCDDSVVRRSGGRNVFLRRSRGYTPRRFSIDLGREPILALGPETGVTFALYVDGAVTLSQHIGSVNNLESFEFLRQAIDHLERLVGAGDARRIACDLHPQFMTSHLARDLAVERAGAVTPVQHHVAHFVGAMAEHGVDEAVGVVLDGYGYGADGSAWGGEMFVARSGAVRRAGSLKPVRLPGGDAATRHPLRVAAGYLAAGGCAGTALGETLIAAAMSPQEASAVLLQLSRGVNAPWTTSAGRFLDAVAASIGVCRDRTYEGEPAMRLEAAARGGTARSVPVPILEKDGWVEIDLVSGFLDLLAMFRAGVTAADVAASAQEMLARGTADAAVRLARRHGVEVVCLSGGVAVNDAIAASFRRDVERAGLRVVTNEWAPCGDGGVSFGQAAFLGAGWRFETGVGS
jgi:hydrogenase maturation protein HypF